MNSWKKLLSHTPVEFLSQELKIVQGQLPLELKGTLYRNTAAIQKRKNGYPGHLFDGDGVILKVEFMDNKAYGSYKYVQSEGFIEEQQKDEFIYPGLGRTYSGNIITKAFNSLSIKNSANTSVLPLKNEKLLALWEGGLPTALKKSDLSTIGLTNCGRLQKGDTFSAHPKIDPKTKLIYNVGLLHGMNETINVYEMDAEGNILRVSSAPMDGRRFILHDFVFAGDYLVLLVYAQFITDMHKVLLGAKAMGEGVLDDPSKGIQVLVFDRTKNLQCIANKIDYKKFMSWHYSNGYVDQNGNVVTQLVTYPNNNVYESFFIDRLQKNELIDQHASYDRLTINPKTGDILQVDKISDDTLEFPIVHDEDVGQKQDTSYALILQKKNDWFNGVIRIDENDYSKSFRRFYGVGQYLSEALYIQNINKEKGQGWLIFVIFDGNVNKSFVEIIDSKSFETVCSLELPEIIAISFHGRFEYPQ